MMYIIVIFVGTSVAIKKSHHSASTYWMRKRTKGEYHGNRSSGS